MLAHIYHAFEFAALTELPEQVRHVVDEYQLFHVKQLISGIHTSI